MTSIIKHLQIAETGNTNANIDVIDINGQEYIKKISYIHDDNINELYMNFELNKLNLNSILPNGVREIIALREINKLLSHPFIDLFPKLHSYEFDLTNNTVIIIEEYAAFGTLRDFIAQWHPSLPEEEIPKLLESNIPYNLKVSLFYRIMISIFAIQTFGHISHADITTSNIVIAKCKDEHINYNLGEGIIVSIRTYGYKPLLIDFDKCVSYVENGEMEFFDDMDNAEIILIKISTDFPFHTTRQSPSQMRQRIHQLMSESFSKITGTITLNRVWMTPIGEIKNILIHLQHNTASMSETDMYLTVAKTYFDNYMLDDQLYNEDFLKIIRQVDIQQPNEWYIFSASHAKRNRHLKIWEIATQIYKQQKPKKIT